MEEFYRKIYLFRPNRVEPIKIARDSQLKITVELMDYTIPSGSTAGAFATGSFGGAVYTQACTVSGNKLSFTPTPGFFVDGKNILQFELNNGVIPLAIDVNCEISISGAGDATEPEAVKPYVQRAEEAAKKSEAAAARAEDVKNSIPADYTALNNNVNQLKDDIYSAIVPGKRYKTIPGKAFDGFGKLTEYDDAFLVLLEVPADCAFLIVTKFNYQVAYGSGFRYSIPRYLDADYNRISKCKVNANADTIDNTNEFGIITLGDVPENAAYIAIPYANGTDYHMEYVYLDYAEKLSGCLIDGHLPYGMQLFEDGRNIVQKIFQNVVYSNANKNFNYKSGSRCTAPILCSGGSRIYHDGVANTMYYVAFDSANGYISFGNINSGSTLPEIENVAYWIFQSVKDFSWISYSDLSLAGYKQPKKIRDDFLDLHITRKKLEYPYNGMVASFLGDSLTQNGSGGDYIRYINSFFAFSKITNCGIGGTRISGESSAFGDPMWKDIRINALDIDSDIIFVMGGTNDAPSGAPYLGDITPDNHDTSTFVGAYNVLLSKIYYRYCLVDGMYDGVDYSGVTRVDTARDIRIFLITPPQRFPNRDSTENPWHFADNTNLYADAVLKIGTMHGIPVADIRSCAGVNIFNRDRYICGPDVSNRNGSGVHLSKDAHKRWAEVIIGKMLETVAVD